MRWTGWEIGEPGGPGSQAGGLQAETVIPLLASPDASVREAAWWIAARHPTWAGPLASAIDKRLSAATATDREQRELLEKLTEFGDNAAIQQLVATMAMREGATSTRATALEVMSATRLRELPASWIPALVRALTGDDAESLRLAVRVAGRAPAPKALVPDLRTALLAVVRAPALRHDVTIDLKIDALAAAAAGIGAIDSDLFSLVRTALGASQRASLRLAAASVIEKVRLDRAQLYSLVDIIKTAGPLETPRLLTAFDRDTVNDEALGLALIAALESSSGRSNLRADVLRPRLVKFPPAVRRRGEALLDALTADTARQTRRLEELLGNVQNGDRRRGQAVFNGVKGACATCHAIGYLGGKMGPDLTRIGEIRSERDLLEALVFPNASFARGFEPVRVTTNAGAVHDGLLRTERSDEIILTQGEGQEVRILREDIDDIQPGSISPMPSGYAEALTRAELADLLAFLKATRWGSQ